MENKENDIPVEEREKLHKLCKSYLGAQWSEINTTDLIIKPITEGFVNKLYLCCLPDDYKQTARYNKVVVRYVDYEQFKDFMDETQVLTINLLLSSINISPKLLGVFPNGTINEYIDSRYFNATDDLNPKTVTLLAQKVATIHSQRMPIPKHTKPMIDVFDEWLTDELRQSLANGIVRQQMLNRYEIKDMDLMAEMSWLSAAIKQLRSPIVFSHNDFNRRNTLVRESTMNNNQELDIYLIDFDFSNYDNRGVDFGQYFAGWGQKVTDFGDGQFPADHQMLPFIDAYIDEMCKIHGNSFRELPINSRQSMTKEAKVYTLMAYIKDILYIIWETTNSKRTDLVPKAEIRYNCYRVLKKRILEEYSDIN